MRSVLVSGPADEAGALACALRRQGFATFGLDLPPALGTGASGERPIHPVDCYVQLPPASDSGPGGGSATRSLLARVEAVSVVSPLLAHDATVLMVADDCDRRRRDALRLMAEAALNDVGEGRRSVVVLDEPLNPRAMAAAALRREANHRFPLSLAGYAPELPYAEWRNEIFSLTAREDSILREYLAVEQAFNEIVEALHSSPS